MDIVSDPHLALLDENLGFHFRCVELRHPSQEPLAADGRRLLGAPGGRLRFGLSFQGDRQFGRRVALDADDVPPVELALVRDGAEHVKALLQILELEKPQFGRGFAAMHRPAGQVLEDDHGPLLRRGPVALVDVSVQASHGERRGPQAGQRGRREYEHNRQGLRQQQFFFSQVHENPSQPKSTDNYHLLRSLCQQIKRNYFPPSHSPIRSHVIPRSRTGRFTGTISSRFRPAWASTSRASSGSSRKSSQITRPRK